MSVCVYVCECVCVREIERDSQSQPKLVGMIAHNKFKLEPPNVDKRRKSP